MKSETGQAIRVDGVFFENPIKQDNPDEVITIVVSRRRLLELQSRMCSVFISSGGSVDEYKKLLLMGNNIANILMPNMINSGLRGILTPGQYQRALRANEEGKIIKFSINRKKPER